MHKIVRYLFLSGSLLFFLIGLFFESPKVLLISTLIIFSHNIIYSLKNFYEKVIFFSFNVTFFIFLLGRMVVSEFFGYKNGLSGIFGLAFKDESLVNLIIICLFLSLWAIFIGYKLIQKVNLDFLKKKRELKASYIYSLRTFSLLFFYFCMVFRLYYIYEMQQTAMSEGYYESFMSFTSSMPSVLVTISNMYDVAFLSYLATNPAKRKSLFPILLYIGEGFFAALAGRRSIFMLNLLIVFIYFCVRTARATKYQDEKKWLGKPELTFGVIGLPVLMGFLSFIGKLRSSFKGSNVSLNNPILEFFFSQGISANLIGYTKVYEEHLPKGILYTFGPIMEFVNNKIIRPLNGLPEFFGQNIDRAVNGHLFSHALPYLIMPSAYLMGHGYGSSFIAEMYHDFSFLGVFIGSIVYGAIIYVFYYMLQNSNYIIVIFTLMMTRAILFAPRGAALSFIVSAFSLSKIVAVIFIVVGSTILYSIIGEKRLYRLPTPKHKIIE